MRDDLPDIIREVGFDFSWDEKKVWALDEPVVKGRTEEHFCVECAIEALQSDIAKLTETLAKLTESPNSGRPFTPTL
ncbi:MAG: hypothetical protein Q8R13_02030 [bacterium]|nr:hypothetical protein [bacterium]MDZ4295949.1 hypothetical protein [Patescibacteria group bacterium]